MGDTQNLAVEENSDDAKEGTMVGRDVDMIDSDDEEEGEGEDENIEDEENKYPE